MTLAEFKSTLSSATPPPGLGAPLEALWHDGRGDWDRAHRTVMSARGRNAAWVHAYLHRKEGDRDNARYWYDRAQQPVASGLLATEWTAIASALLDGQ